MRDDVSGGDTVIEFAARISFSREFIEGRGIRLWTNRVRQLEGL